MGGMMKRRFKIALMSIGALVSGLSPIFSYMNDWNESALPKNVWAILGVIVSWAMGMATAGSPIVVGERQEDQADYPSVVPKPDNRD